MLRMSDKNHLGYLRPIITLVWSKSIFNKIKMVGRSIGSGITLLLLGNVVFAFLESLRMSSKTII